MGEGEWSPRIFDRSESQQSACDGDKWCLLCIIILVVISRIRERASDLIRNREPGGETRLMQQSTVRRLKTKRNKGEKSGAEFNSV